MWTTYDPDDYDIDGRNAVGTHWDSQEESLYPDYPVESEEIYPFQFRSEESMVQSPVFQKHLKMSLAFKDKIILDLQNELLKV